MRQNNKNNRSRGRGGRKGPNPLTRSYESNGPDVKVRGTAQHVAEKYLTLARDALSAGDGVSAEAFFQHAEHYNRIIMAAQAQQNQMRDDDRRQGFTTDPSHDHNPRDNGDQGENAYDDDGMASYDQDEDPQPSIDDIAPVSRSEAGREHNQDSGSRDSGPRDEEAASKPARRRPQQRPRRAVTAEKAAAIGRESAPQKKSDSIADNPPAFLVTD